MTRFEPADFCPDLAIPPGETIAELLQELEVSILEFADLAGLTEDQSVALLKGDHPIGPELAQFLGEYFRMPPYVWEGLERNYRRTLQRLDEEALQSGNVKFARRFPLADMVNFGWIEPSNRPEEQADYLLDFLGIPSWQGFSTSPIYTTHFRKSPAHTASDYAMVAWLTRGRQEAVEVKVGPFDLGALRGQIAFLRTLTRGNPAGFAPLIRSSCGECGVAVVFVPAPRRCTASGAAYKVGDRHVVQLSVRHKRNDHFWFSLFHELGHVLLHSGDTFVDDFEYDADPREEQANRFSSDFLLPPEIYNAWRTRTVLTRDAIRAFADQIGITPGIIVGRLQRDRLLGYEMFPDLFQRISFAD